MELKIYKVYNRVVHSYLAVFETEQTGSEDPNIFVCKDLPDNPPIPPAPPQESSQGQEVSSSETSSPQSLSEIDSSLTEQVSSLGAGSHDLGDDSSMIVESESSSLEDPSAEEQTSSAEEVSSSDLSEATMEESSVESSVEEPMFVVFPARTLVSVASLTDIDLLPITPLAPGSLYRASTVAMLFRSEAYMEQVVDLVIADVRINADLQRMPIENYEVVELTDPVYGQDEDQIYYFR